MTSTTHSHPGDSAAARRFFLGVDVGTGSARAGLFDAGGTLVATAKADIEIHREPGNIVEQSSEQIWEAVCLCVREAVRRSGIDREAIAGIGFDATCSLVVRGRGGAPLPVGDAAHPERDVIVWMDHRALDQAARINELAHPVLDYVGGRISPEMQTPKLLWLKENRRSVYDAAEAFFDLSDFLGWKATGSLARSVCTVTCKWTYLAHEGRWDPSYFRAIGLSDLADQDFARIGTTIVEPGTPLGRGLTEEAAERLGLKPGTAVGAGLIDAHAGGIGTVGAAGGSGDATRSLAYVFGTSSCTMTTTREPAFVPGVWGPYYSAMVPGAWLNEGGQSAAGAAIDHLVTMHRAYTDVAAEAKAAGKPAPVLLADRALGEAGEASAAVTLAGAVHVVPEFLGNRAPFADPHARALVAGIGMEHDAASLLALYVAGICGLGYGLRQIVETQAANGAPVEEIAISGGAGQHELIRQLLADATGLPLRAVECEEPVLSGSAILGAVAAGAYETIEAAMPAMSRVGRSYAPAGGPIRETHERRYRAFLALQKTAREIRASD
ncbi:ribulokinase [Fulvimarina endophytica]|uniref:Ribulokinase n=1 Tax=Fulvimarina endophytica TaxID=2293836 RepID=A0A371X2J2_9HYPH|nr:FGGY-family carbohydrate kinase [Fulvimarina endophytica]RFC63433.1 ribulokinase [Fulvimarina endophytica]